MTDHKLPDAITNRSLFSDYYLQSLLREQPQWTETPNLEAVIAEMKQHYEAIQETADHLVEAQTERQFIQPVLTCLGHAFEVQPTLHTSQGAKRPDYAFFADADARDAAQPRINTKAFFKTAIAIGDAKAWSRDLDRKSQGRGDPFTHQNPSYQIDFYLREADKMWGILTNGRQWRLYHRQTSYRLDCFYQVDLGALLSQNGAPSLEAFRYFYCLFRRDAFRLGAEGKCFLDSVLEGSQHYSVGISDRLKEQIYDALRLLIDGFVDFPRNRFDKAKPPLEEIHENSLILLYRILFILYAESRGLLPVENPDYDAQYSFTHLATEIHQKLEGGRNISSQTNIYWARLQALFQLINEGWANLIPQYNGGLFNPKHHPFLENYTIGDEALAKVIHLLTWTETGEHIVYRDLEVRHLGSIYEGLLEYQPRLAAEDMVIVSQKKGETVEPSAAHPNRNIAYRAGEVYLETDKGERKATGSYYTPDYIVRYIVENTLAPLCKGKSVADILKLKVLDPAIGSGHFLVGAVDYLALELATHPRSDDRDSKQPDAPLMTNPSPPQAGGKTVDTEIAYWRRRVVESCVYGVDVNPMAVELAKLSLWLHTVARGEPLSFLDHHIRCGNSLIGAKIDDLPNLPALKSKLRRSRNPDLSGRKTESAQTELALEFPFTATVAKAIGHYLMIETTESRTADQVHAKEHELDIAQTMLRYHKGVANLWTSIYFGNEVSRSAYHQAVTALKSEETAKLESLMAYQRAQKIAAEKRFFHWEIEFPEVFRDRFGREKENPGFDAVVGNPPWVSLKGKFGEDLFSNTELTYFVEKFRGSTYMPNLFEYFVILGITLVRIGGYNAMIVPDRLGFNLQYRDLRKTILDTCELISLVYKAEFPDVTVDTLIYCLYRCQRPRPDWEMKIAYAEQSPITVKQGAYMQDEDWGFWYFENSDAFMLIRKVETAPTQPLGAYFESTSGFGGKSTEMTEVQTSADQIPAFKGENISRYSLEGCFYFRFVKENITGRTTDREKLGAAPKVLLRKTGVNLVATFDESGTYPEQSLYFLFNKSGEVDFLYVLSLLNSRLINFYYLNRLVTNKESIAQLKKVHLDALPIRCINFTTPAAERERFREEGRILYDLFLSEGNTDRILGFVAHHLSTEKERSDVVHDLLAFLAEQMIDMNKAKGEEIRGFLRWLEREIGVSVDALKNKTAVFSYYEKELTELIDVLKANRRAIGVDVSARDFQERLEGEFNTSVGKLRPLMDRIQKTDALIDRIVYQLYGLTEAEIEIVENKK